MCMKLKIQKEFYDKYTNELYKVGSEIDFTDERAKEILANKGELVNALESEKLEFKLEPTETKRKKKRG